MRVLVTGAAGFVGFSVTKALLAQGIHVVGLDNLNAYYEVRLKEDRLAQLKSSKNFRFVKADVSNLAALRQVFSGLPFDRVIHLAAQAGVRYFLTNPDSYVQSNLVGFLNILEMCRHAKTPHLIYASSSSVYGANETLPFSEEDNVDHPLSLYGATKKSNELMAHSYSHLYQLPTTGLRFFTVYGPWGRPDMAVFLFTKAILEDKPVFLFNEGNMIRDFTYIDDVVEAVLRIMEKPPQPSEEWPLGKITPHTSRAPYRVYNIGHSHPIYLKDFIQAIEKALGKKAKYVAMPMQAGDVKSTHADVSALVRDFHLSPKISIEEGISNFVHWFKSYYAEKVV